MTATTTDRAALAAPRTGSGLRARDLLRSEWTKIRTLRSTVWSLVALVVVTIGFTVLLTSLTAAYWNSAHGHRADTVVDPTGTIFGGFGYSELIVCILGALSITGEYGTGMIRSSVLAVPRRVPMLVAKAAVFGGVVLVIGELLGIVVFYVGSAILSSHLSVSLGQHGVLRAVLCTGPFLAVMGLIAVAIGALVRRTAGAIGAVVGLIVVLSVVASALPGTVGQYIRSAMPTNAGQLVLQTTRHSGDLLTAWQGFGVMCLWALALLGLAGWLLRRRDV